MDLLTRIRMAPMLYFVVIGTVLGSFYYFWMFDSGGNIETRIQTSTAELQKATSDLADTNRVIADKTQFQTEFQEVSEKFRAAIEYLPENFNVQELLKQISDEARASGVNLVSVKPRTPQQKEFYEELSMDIELEGPFSLLTTFLAYMSKQNRIVNVKDIDIHFKSMVDGNPRLTMKGTLQAYRYKKPAEGAKPKGGANGAKPRGT
jgi:Tfp pilus assembly protein PilO